MVRVDAHTNCQLKSNKQVLRQFCRLNAFFQENPQNFASCAYTEKEI